MQNKTAGSTVIPCLRYKDAPAAIEWLCRAIGFKKHLVAPDDNGGIAHAQLKLGLGMIMLGSTRDGEYDTLLRQPGEAGGETQTPYIVVEDADAHYAMAKEANAEILMEIADQPHGGRLFSCRDPEGHVWNVGSYDPWAEIS